MVKIAPSVLSADFSRLGEEVARIAATGLADRVHIDVMDGVFVPNLTVGPLVVAALRPRTTMPLESHLMIREPSRYIREFVAAGSDVVIVHYEACSHVHRDVQLIRELGARAGVALNPGTPEGSIVDLLGDLDVIVVMTVNPGFGGQKFIPAMLPKIARLRELLNAAGSPAEIEVDGGVNATLASRVVSAGAQILVAGSAVFHHPDGPEKALAALVAATTGNA